MTFPTDLTVPLYKNMMRDAPHVQCTMRDTGVSTNLIVNREAPPFDDPKIRRALALTLDRQAFIDILSEGEGQHGRRHAAAAGRRVGHAAGDAEDHHRLRQRASQPREGARADEGGGLRPRQAAEGQGQHAQHRHLPRSGDHPDRPSQAHLCRRRARGDRHLDLLQPRVQEGLRRGAQPHRHGGRRSRRHASSRAMPAARCATTTTTATRR